MPTRDEAKGTFDRAKGKVKQGVGKATGDERLHDEGVADEVGGEVREGFGKAKRRVGDAVKDLGERMKR